MAADGPAGEGGGAGRPRPEIYGVKFDLPPPFPSTLGPDRGEGGTGRGPMGPGGPAVLHTSEGPLGKGRTESRGIDRSLCAHAPRVRCACVGSHTPLGADPHPSDSCRARASSSLGRASGGSAPLRC